MTAGSLMAAELAEQPQVLGRLVSRHAADRDQVRAVLPGRLLPGRLAGTVLLARGSSDNVAVYGRYLIELASRRPAGLAAPSVHTRYEADVDYSLVRTDEPLDGVLLRFLGRRQRRAA